MQRLALESAYSLRSATAPSLRLDFMILLHTVLITFGLRKPMSYEKALRMAQPLRSFAASVRKSWRCRRAALRSASAPVTAWRSPSGVFG